MFSFVFSRVFQVLKARPRSNALLASAALTLATSCGPSLYSFNAIPAAQVVEEAEQAGAAERAPYEYYLAREYLDKAREEASEANYQDAVELAERARELGENARDTARRRMRQQREAR